MDPDDTIRRTSDLPPGEDAADPDAARESEPRDLLNPTQDMPTVEVSANG